MTIPANLVFAQASSNSVAQWILDYNTLLAHTRTVDGDYIANSGPVSLAGNTFTVSGNVVFTGTLSGPTITSIQANATIQASEILSIQNNISTLQSNATVQAAEISTLQSNATVQASEILSIQANATIQAAEILALQSNATVQAAEILALQANATLQQTLIDAAITEIGDNQFTGVNIFNNTLTANGDTFTSTANVVITGTFSAANVVINNAITGLKTINSGQLSHRNIIINGDMRIKQRYSTETGSGYVTDRTRVNRTSAFSWACDQSNTAPAGFSNSLYMLNGTGAFTGSTDYAIIQQKIEGSNITQLNPGTSDAKIVTFSFWARASVTGTYGVFARNADNDRSYVTTFDIDSADTWEYKSVTFTMDTSGTWATDETEGLNIGICLTAGSNFQGTNGSWEGANDFGSSSVTNSLMSTTGSTFYTTGWQLEIGETATEFEHKSLATELNDCFRYFFNVNTNDRSSSGGFFATGISGSGTQGYFNIILPTQMRVAPSVTVSAGAHFEVQGTTNLRTCSGVSCPNGTFKTQCHVRAITSASFGSGQERVHFTSPTSSEARYIYFDAEL